MSNGYPIRTANEERVMRLSFPLLSLLVTLSSISSLRLVHRSIYRTAARLNKGIKMSAEPQLVASASEDQLKHNFSWQQTMLRIKDPKLSVPFYEQHFGFKLIHHYDFPQW